jgi:glycosyltransferase involved in cell wall biosynthesis
MRPPLFSVGVTTYDREDLLRETVQSILAQRDTDFEVIIGNDNPRRVITQDFLGVQDSRVRIVNHRQNLGEHRNMNALLAMGRGRYFTWLADDDLYAPMFLERVASSILGEVSCVFSSSTGNRKLFDETCLRTHWGNRFYDGRDFLDAYLSRAIRVIGCYGVFERQALLALGGMQRLGTGFSPYSDNLLAIRAGTLDRVVHIDAPLIFYRAHDGSPSHSSSDVSAYFTAQRDLLHEAGKVLPYRESRWLLLRWCLIDLANVVSRGDGSKFQKVLSFWQWASLHLQDRPSALRGVLLTVKLSKRACGL